MTGGKPEPYIIVDLFQFVEPKITLKKITLMLSLSRFPYNLYIWYTYPDIFKIHRPPHPVRILNEPSLKQHF